MKFVPGEQVVCNAPKHGWKFLRPVYKGWGFWPFKREVKCIGPDEDEVVTIVATHHPNLVWLKEYPNHGHPFFEHCFDPLPGISEIYQVLEKKPFEL